MSDTRELLLIRHAKAEQGDDDAARELTPRGRRDATALGAWLAEHQLVPDLVLISPAARAQQTWSCAAAGIGAPSDEPATSIETGIYDNTASALLKVVNAAQQDVRRIALVGHNPSMELLAWLLDDGHGESGARSRLTAGLSTSTVAVFATATSFAELGSGGARLLELHSARA